MTEHTLVKQLLALAREELKGYVIQKHNDRANSGIPDISVTGLGFTSWWEIKCANPMFDSPGIQELNCLRLAVAGFCAYIIYDYRDEKNPNTHIVHPRHLKSWTNPNHHSASWSGAAHSQLVARIGVLHSITGREK
jgi:hypothetical protein